MDENTTIDKEHNELFSDESKEDEEIEYITLEETSSEQSKISDETPVKKKKSFIKFLFSFKKAEKPQVKENETSVSSLKEAYQLLEIDTYPVTYEQIREQFYKVWLKQGKKEELLEKLTEAKEMIFTQMSVNPFEEPPAEEEEVESTVKETRIKTFLKQKQTAPKKKNWSDVKSQLGCEDDPHMGYEPRFVIPPKKSPVKRAIRYIIAFAILFVAVILVINGKSKPLPFEGEPNNGTMTFETSLELLEKDGVSAKETTIPVLINNITEYSCRERISLSGYHLIERSFILHQDYATVSMKTYTVYKNTSAALETESWKKTWEHSKTELLNLRLDGEWSGTCLVEGKYEINGLKLNLTVTDNGYVYGAFDFLTSQDGHGLLDMEGMFDFDKNKLLISGTTWQERPSLFITPTLEGYYDISTGHLVSGSAKTVFDFYKEPLSGASLSDALFIGLLKEDTAVYKDFAVPLGYLKDFSSKQVVKGDTCTLTYQGVIDRDMIDYTVKGKATLQRTRGIWHLEENTAEAEFLELNMCGVYTGTDWSGGKTWDAEYIISATQNPNEYLAKVTLKRGLKKIKEIRAISIVEGGITTARRDIYKGKAYGTGVLNSNVDYAADGFTNDGELTIRKVETW